MTPEQAEHYRFRPFGVTKGWPHCDFALMDVKYLVLSHNPEHHFA